MTMLPKEAILEYQQIFKEQKGVLLSFEEAQKQAMELMAIYQAVYQPIKNEWITEVNTKYKYEKQRKQK